jgi:hypothetical protein
LWKRALAMVVATGTGIDFRMPAPAMTRFTPAMATTWSLVAMATTGHAEGNDVALGPRQ